MALNNFQIAQGQRTAVWKNRDACHVAIGINKDGSVVVKDVKQMILESKLSAGKDVGAEQRVKATSSEEEQTANGMV